MKQFKLFFLLFVLMSMIGNKALAYDAVIDGIYYNFSGYEATVTYRGSTYGDYREYSDNVVIPETVNYNSNTYTVTSIGFGAFGDCPGLNSIEIPSSVTSIGVAAFFGCKGLASIEIPSSVTSIGANAFFNCKGLASIEIPSSVTSIGANAFEGCTGLQKVIVNDIAAWCNIQFANSERNPLH